VDWLHQSRPRVHLDRVAGRDRDHRDLAAMVFPALARAKERTRQTSCLNNLRQVALAYTMYQADPNRRLHAGITHRANHAQKPCTRDRGK
jgi:hypothetical protein